jgi:hypothetical protein
MSGIGAQVEEVLKLARAVVIEGRPKSSVHSLIEADGLLVDVRVYSRAGARGLMRRIFRRLRNPRTWLSYVGARLGLRFSRGQSNDAPAPAGRAPLQHDPHKSVAREQS